MLGTGQNDLFERGGGRWFQLISLIFSYFIFYPESSLISNKFVIFIVFQADYLQPRLLGVIGFFDSQLLNNNIPLEDKKLVIYTICYELIYIATI